MINPDPLSIFLEALAPWPFKSDFLKALLEDLIFWPMGHFKPTESDLDVGRHLLALFKYPKVFLSSHFKVLASIKKEHLLLLDWFSK
jgi:hypothetical protein